MNLPARLCLKRAVGRGRLADKAAAILSMTAPRLARLVSASMSVRSTAAVDKRSSQRAPADRGNCRAPQDCAQRRGWPERAGRRPVHIERQTQDQPADIFRINHSLKPGGIGAEFGAPYGVKRGGDLMARIGHGQTYCLRAQIKPQ